MFRKLQRIVITLTSIYVGQVFCDSQPISGLLGGLNGEFQGTIVIIPVGSQYGATVSPFGAVTPLNLGPTIIDTVALNASGLGLIGGRDEHYNLYAAFVSAEKGLQEVPLPSISSVTHILSVAINDGGLGLIGARRNNPGFAAFVTPDSVTPVALNLPIGEIRTVALSNSNVGIVGGQTNPFVGQAYAALVFPNGTSQEIVLGLTDTSEINKVVINDSNVGLIVGTYDTSGTDFPYAAYVLNGVAAPLSIPSAVHSSLRTAAINDSGVGLIGGNNSFVAFVSPNLTLQLVSGIPNNATILSSAINESGHGLIGGVAVTNMYAALITPEGGSISLQSFLPKQPGIITSVALNEFNQGLIGGDYSNPRIPFAAIVSPSGVVTPLNLGFSPGLIFSVATNAFFLSQLPIEGLHGNNKRFANYINAYVPENVFYFVPALVEGSFANALQSAAPTRNAITFVTGLQNAFYFTTAFSTHLREQKSIHSRPFNRNASTAQFESSEETEEEFLASRCFPDPKTKERGCKKRQKDSLTSNTVWLEAVGALAYQSSQHQTPGFNPSSGGAILGYDGEVTKEFTIGGGATYLYTHIHEKQDAGSAHLNQEDLFVYGSWNPEHFYLDLGLWGGLFQTHQDRHIHMPGFSFHAISKPKGWQLTPHLELGWIGEIKRTQKIEVDWTLLGMLDWAHAWQRKYKEKGSGPFNVQQNSHHGSLLRTEAGLRFSETFYYSCWNLILQEKGSYVNVQSFNAGTVKGFIVASPGSFTLETLNNAQNLGVIQFLISGASYKKWHPTGTLFYQGEFGSSYQSHQLGIEFAMSF